MANRILLQDWPDTPEGRLTLAGVIEGGHGISRAGWRRYPAYAFIYIPRGNGIYLHGSGRSEPIDEGDAILIFPGVAHTYGPRNGDVWDEVYVVIEGSGIERWHASGLISPESPILRLHGTGPTREEWLEILESPAPVDVWTSLELFHRFMGLLAIAIGRARPHAELNTLWLAEAKAVIEKTLAEAPDLRLLAERDLGMPYETFRKRFLREAGVSPGQFREQRRISRAIELLRYTQLPHREIAEILGFEDALYFSRRFKHAVGISPRTYRQRELGEEILSRPT